MIVYHAYRKDHPSFYIGKTAKSLSHRRRQHENEARLGRSRTIFHKALRKHGADNFEWRVLAECATVDEMNETERVWIARVRGCGHKLYNMTDGGDGGDCGGSAYWKNKSPTQEMREKISKSLKAYYAEHQSPRKGVSCEGRKHSAESKKKISGAKMGHPVSEATREKLRSANLGKRLQPHVIDMLREKFSGASNPSAKRVVCTTTGEAFDTAAQAAEKYGLDLSTIIKCCRGKAKTTKGYAFQYAPTAYPAGWEVHP